MIGEWIWLAAGKYNGLCTKESIHSIEDFRKTVGEDRLLSAHFSGFNWESARLGKQERDVWVYVSYRKDDVIGWTSKPIRLPKGDGYISDEFHTVRTYWCNDYDTAAPPKRCASPAGACAT